MRAKYTEQASAAGTKVEYLLHRGSLGLWDPEGISQTPFTSNTVWMSVQRHRRLSSEAVFLCHKASVLEGGVCGCGSQTP